MKYITFDTLATDLHWTWKRNTLPGYTAFFLSFTDALRYLVRTAGMNKDTVVLLPDFYCPHTAHALMTMATVRFYRVNDDLTVDEDDLKNQVQRTKPAMVVLYSFFGGSIGDAVYRFLEEEVPDALVVDDYAHRSLVGHDIVWKHPNHIYIDSIRKHTPYLGSHMVSKKDFGRLQGSINGYILFCHLLRACENAANVAARITGSSRMRDVSNRLFEALDSRIGDGQEAVRGGRMAETQWPYIDITRVKLHKERLRKRYASALRTKLSTLIEQYEVCYLPLFAKGTTQEELIEALDAGGVSAEKMWEYERWMPERSRDLFDSMVILPLTGAMTEKDVDTICDIITNIHT